MTKRDTRPHRPDPLADTLRRLGRVRRPVEAPRPAEGDLPARLARLEQEVGEVRSRVNALFFAVLTAALGDLAGRVVLG